MSCFVQSNSKNAAQPSAEKTRGKMVQRNIERPMSAGFSLIELLIVIVIIGILTAISILPLLGTRKAYRTEDQAMRILDFMRDANQRALAQRQVMRLEIDDSDKIIRIIDENTVASGNTDDVVVRRESLDNPINVRVVTRPSNLLDDALLPNVALSTGTTTYPAAQYATSTHPLSINHSVWTARFFSNGSVNNVAGTQLSATLFVWQPGTGANSVNAAPVQLTRAITIFGNTGTVKLWYYNGTGFVAR